MPDGEGNVATLRRIYDAWARGDFRARGRRPSTHVSRPVADRVELLDPRVMRLMTRVVLAAPAPLRRRVLAGAFDRARDAFNRGDLEVVFAAFSPDVVYDPPPPLPGARRIEGRDEVLRYWRGIFESFAENEIENLDVVEIGRGNVQRTARLRHAGGPGGEQLEYEILQTTVIRRGSVVRQSNELR